MYLGKATMKAVSRFKPHHDDFMEALATGVNWRTNLEEAVTAGGCVMIQPFDAERACEVFPMAIGGNMGDQVWFVTSADSAHWGIKTRMDFRKLIMEYRDKMLEIYPVLWNYVWVGNKSHYRFLKSIGAVFHEEYTESPITGEKFQLFTITKEV
ncbi:MAG: DUF2833 domain-containing protein [Spirochaetia bacterium]|nr:DUF2833 domain-containing protein [Spirochaetia bacterium]